MKIKSLIILAAATVSAFPLTAADFLSTDKPDNTFVPGVRIGINTANATIDPDYFSNSLSAWGTGFDLGVVMDIYFRDWISVQPGIFYESRSNKYVYEQLNQDIDYLYNGHTLDYSIKVPIVASAHFNITDRLRWNVDFGPYVSVGIGKHDEGTLRSGDIILPYSNGFYKNRNRWTVGMKMGTGITFMNHYYFGVHYLAGISDVYKDYGGRSKAWTFTIGYKL